MNKVYDITSCTISQHAICFTLSEQKISVPLSQTGSCILPRAADEELQIFEIDEDGIGIYWPLLDEDLSIEGLLHSAGREDLIVHEIPSIYIEEEPASRLNVSSDISYQLVR